MDHEVLTLHKLSMLYTYPIGAVSWMLCVYMCVHVCVCVCMCVRACIHAWNVLFKAVSLL